MSENDEHLRGQLVGDGIQRMPVECPMCKKRFDVVFPPLEVSNNLRSSMIVAVHPNLLRCPQCSQPFTYQITGQYSISFQVVPVNDDAVAQVEGSRIIKPELKLM